MSIAVSFSATTVSPFGPFPIIVTALLPISPLFSQDWKPADELKT